jgi:methionine synthase II (cobalamin-independent)
MLTGRWPRITADGTDLSFLEAGITAGFDAVEHLGKSIEALVGDIVRAQADAGLDLVTDGEVRWPDPGAALLRALAADDTGPNGHLLRGWLTSSALTDHVVAQVVPGPYSLGRRVQADASAADRQEFTLELAARLAGELAALAGAGCAMAVIEEPNAVSIGADDGERDLFSVAQARLLADGPSLHATLGITGGSAWEAGADTILGAPYQSYRFDLVAGPDNWHLVRAVPGDRGVVCGALRADSAADQAPELVWAAKYAASSNGRGLERVGLTNAGTLDGLTPDECRRAAAALVRAAHLASLPLEQAIAEGLDPRTIEQPSDPPTKRPSSRKR